MGALSPSLRDWIVPGLAGTLAIVDANGAPQIARTWGARVLDESDVIEVLVQRGSAAGVLGALDRPRRAALTLIEVASYRSRSFKGACERSPRGFDADALETSVAALGRAFHAVGLAADGAERMLGHAREPREMVALRLSVESVFDQSPKPGAGARL